MLGLLISFFMLGMLIGVKATDIIINNFKASSYSLIQLLLAIYTIALPLVFYLLNKYSINSLLIKIIFILIITDIGAITGLLFSYAVRLQGQQNTMLAARSYSSDLVGSALGVLLVSALLLPLLGLTITCLIIGSLNILAVIRIRF